jgi:hypothetical protein
VLGVALLLALPSLDAAAIMAGAAPDTPDARVDPNTTTSPWAGVGSLTVSGNTVSATVVGRRHVLTAAHVVGTGPAGVTFNLNFGSALSHSIPAAAVFRHPSFIGFNNPNLQHDLALVELTADVPDGVPIYPLHYAPLPARAQLTMVGYGKSGQGNVGATVGASPSVKRTGINAADAFELDVDGSGRNALFQFDFDGQGANNYLGLGSLGNDKETSFSDGDSGGPGFYQVSGQWRLAAVNTFLATFSNGPTMPSTFATGGGGILVYAYQTWIQSVLSRPTNDTFVNRAALGGPSGAVSGSNAGATKETGEPSHVGNPGGKSVWWKWIAPGTGPVTFTTQGSGFDTLLAAYTGNAVNALSLVAQDNDSGGAGTSAMTFVAQAQTEYQIAVDGFAAASGSVTLDWDQLVPVTANVPALPWWGMLTLAAGLLAVVTSTNPARRGRECA